MNKKLVEIEINKKLIKELKRKVKESKSSFHLKNKKKNRCGRAHGPDSIDIPKI